MPDRLLAKVFDRLRSAAAHGDVGASDAQLLERFVSHRDEAAFEVLVWRHRRLVFGVCRRVLHDSHDAEDAFQAAFLILAQKAGSIGKREALSAWLYRVAHRVALAARAERSRRTAHERSLHAAEGVAASPAPGASPEGRDLWKVLDAEVSRLPAPFRDVTVLCYLEGRTVAEAAHQLGCPRGTAASRLARARERLRLRLARRGLTLSAGALVALTAAHLRAPASDGLVCITVRVALETTKGLAGSAVSGRVATLAQGVLRAMFFKKLMTRALVLSIVAAPLLFGGGLAWWVQANARAGVRSAAGGDEGENPTSGGGVEVKTAPRPVTVLGPVARNVSPFEDFTGRLQARQTVDVRARVSGFVAKVCFEDGAAVKQDDLLFQLDPREFQPALDKAQAEVLQAVARLKLAQAELDRARNLRAGGFSQADLEKATQDAAVAQAACAAAQSAVEVARLNLNYTRVVAPINGTIERRLVDAGNLISGGGDHATILATITVRNPIGLQFDMDERSYLRYQALGNSGEVSGRGSPLYVGLADEEGFPHRGMLDRFGSTVNPATGTIAVHGQLPNPKGALLPGQFVRVRMPFGKPRKVLEVPESAVFSDQGKRYVWVVTDRDVAERRPVTVGQADRDRRVILKGLTAEDRVVIGGANALQPGERVEPGRDRDK